MSSHLAKGKSIGLFKRAWHELPDIVAGTALAVFSGLAYLSLYFYRKNNGTLDVKRYRLEYTVVRPDDPLAKFAPPKEES